QFGEDRLLDIVFRVGAPSDMPGAIQEVRAVLGARYAFDPKDERALSIWDTVKGSGTMTNILLGIQIFLGVIGGLTLMIGGVGVANIMYAVVKERTRELGVKMALGARPGWITGPLLLAGLSYTLVGGLLATIIAVVIVTLLDLLPTDGNRALEFTGKPTLSLPFARSSGLLLCLTALLAG